MSNVETIKDFTGRIIGKIETDSSGNKVVKDFSGRILGRYDRSSDTTKDFSGRIVARGDASVALLYGPR
jgi:hypothetical protein